MTHHHSSQSRLRGFTLMEVLVVIAIILVLAAIAVLAICTFQKRAQTVQALRQMNQLATASKVYINENNNELPMEDGKGSDTWQATTEPENKRAWYDALPLQMGRR